MLFTDRVRQQLGSPVHQSQTLVTSVNSQPFINVPFGELSNDRPREPANPEQVEQPNVVEEQAAGQQSDNHRAVLASLDSRSSAAWRNAQVLERIKNQEIERQKASPYPLNTYSTSPLLIYFISPVQTAIHIERYPDVRVRVRQVKYDRNRSDPQETEAFANRSEYARWRSFFDQSDSPTVTSDSYRNWGRSMKLAYYLAKLGLYYAPQASQEATLRDKIRCAFCKRGKMHWWLYDYPESLKSMARRASDLEVALSLYKWHSSKSPTCPVALNLAVDSLPFDAVQLEQTKSCLQQCVLPETVPRNTSVSARRPAETGYFPTLNSTNTPVNAWLQFPEIVEANVCETDRFSVAKRLEEIPSESKLLLAEEDLAKLEADFAYEPLTLANSKEHEWMATQQQAITYGQFFCAVSYDKHIAKLTVPPKFPEFVSKSLRELTFCRALEELSLSNCCVNDAFYVSECLRKNAVELGSDCWRSDVDASKLAEAGFFTALRGDEVYCYACGLTMQQLSANWDFWIEHAYKSPECAHVLLNRGAAFVREVRERYDSLSSTTDWVRSVYSPFLGFFYSVVHRVEPRDYRARPEVRLLRTVAEECALNATLFAYSIEWQMRKTGKDFDNVVSLIEAVGELATRMRITGTNDPLEFVRRCNEESDALARGTHESQRIVWPSQLGVNAVVPGGGVAGESGDEQGRRGTCLVCLDSPLEVAFVPCGHLAVCFACSLRLTDCPVCRTAIRGTLRVRL